MDCKARALILATMADECIVCCEEFNIFRENNLVGLCGVRSQASFGQAQVPRFEGEPARPVRRTWRSTASQATHLSPSLHSSPSVWIILIDESEEIEAAVERFELGINRCGSRGRSEGTAPSSVKADRNQ